MSPVVLGAVGESRWTYAVSKLAEEDLAYAYFTVRGLPTVSRRYGGRLLRAFVCDSVRGESINIENARTTITVYGLANSMLRVLGSTSQIHFAPRLAADIDLRIPCVEKAQDVLGFEAKLDSEEGIRLTADSYVGAAA